MSNSEKFATKIGEQKVLEQAHTILKNRGLPELCYVFVAGNEPGMRIGIVKRGEPGYTPCYDYDGPRRGETDKDGYPRPITKESIVRAVVHEFNERLGVGPVEAECMFAGSMFGWHVPAADPSRTPKDMAERLKTERAAALFALKSPATRL